jgi:hypothetical protein
MQLSYDKMTHTMTDDQKDRSDIYREVREALKAGKEQYDKLLPYANSLRDSTAQLVQNTVLANDSTFKEIDSMSEYLKYRAAYIEEAEKQGLTKEDAENWLERADNIGEVGKQYMIATEMAKKFAGVTED